MQLPASTAALFLMCCAWWSYCCAGSEFWSGNYSSPRYRHHIKKRLRELVYASINKKTSFPPIAFYKSHKTGSTTVRAVFHRIAARNKLTVVDAFEFLNISSETANVCRGDMVYNHFGVTSQWAIYDAAYSTLLKVPPQSQKRVTVTIVREPLSRAISDYNYFVGGDMNSFKKCLSTGLCFRHLLKHEYHLGNVTMGEAFNVVLLLEKLYESMVLLKRYMRWELIDVAFFTLNTRQEGSKITVAKLQEPKNLPILDIVKNMLKRDEEIYRQSEEAYQNLYFQLVGSDHESFHKEVKELQRMCAAMLSVCSHEPSSLVCKWHTDMGYLGKYNTTSTPAQSCPNGLTIFDDVPWI